LSRSPGTLFVVATPIGNLGDSSPRSIDVLRAADIVACEDTRTSRTLLAHHGIEARTVALHAHNEREAGAKLLKALQEGSSVALISDAGTPGISDPGAPLVAAAHRAGIRVVALPGPNAAVAAYSASGFAGSRFLFAGFLPAKGSRSLDELDGPWPVVLYEAPHRVLETVKLLLDRFGAERELVIARELSKKFEEIARLRLAEAEAWLTAEPHRLQGEFVLVLGPGEPRGAAPDAQRVLKLLLAALPPAEAAKIASKITGAPRRDLYAAALKRAK
jgi:16S rRNA (cytidine1402-2'-O)-methyltransferase